MGGVTEPGDETAIGNMQESAARLVLLAKSRSYSDLEIERLAYDLNQLEARLTSHEYSRTSFKPRNVMSVPERTEELFKDIEFYASMGRIWEPLLRSSIGRDERFVAELGTGPVPKVAIGLHYMQYKGVCDLIDTDPRATTMADEFLNMLGAQFKREQVNQSVLKVEGKRYGALFANHFLDDLILDAYCKDSGESLAALYNDEQLYVKTWQTVLARPELLQRVTKALTGALLSLLRPGGIAVILDYPSFSHRALGLDSVTACVRVCQSLIKEYARAGGAEIVLDLLPHPITIEQIEISPSNLVTFRKAREEV
jgi:hypothetical protein